MEEPLVKKPRTDLTENSIQIKAVLPDDLCNAIPLTKVAVSKIENKKSISSVVLELSRCLPLPSLQHLKRVRQNEIILCLASDCESKQASDDLKDNIKEFIVSKGVPSEMASFLSENASIAEVPSTPTKLRWQYDVMNKRWPCKFHPDKYLESLHNGTNFSNEDRKFHCKIGRILNKLSEKEQKPAGICIDPRTNSIVAMSIAMSEVNPMMHCPMVLVDFVARSQNGGAWEYDSEEFLTSDTSKLNLRGIPKSLHHTVASELNEDVNFGAENVNLREGRVAVDNDETLGSNNLEKYGPYLCTRYDVYLTVEPCLMCAMALIHSRVRRIFYWMPSENGALQTRLKLHAIKELNHHFEVFQFFNGNNN